MCVCGAGTFTLNYMELRKISVGSYSFGLGTTQIGLAGLRRKGAPADVIARRERENAIADKQVRVCAAWKHPNDDSYPARCGCCAHPPAADRRLPC